MDKERSVLAHNIRYLRKREGLNQEELGEKLSIKRSNIAAYEIKNVEPRLRVILNMAKLFNVDLQSFLESKLDDQKPLKSFNDEKAPINEALNLKFYSDIDLDNFKQKSLKIKKVLLGFKTLYALRRSKISQTTPKKERILLDIDNFIMLLEHLLVYNDKVIQASSSTDS